MGEQDCYGSGVETTQLWAHLGTKPRGLSAKQRFKFQKNAPQRGWGQAQNKEEFSTWLLQIFQEIKWSLTFID